MTATSTNGITACRTTPEDGFSVMWMSGEDGWFGRGAASADLVGAKGWWISRVVVNPPKARGGGWGTKMLVELLSLMKKAGVAEVRVCPGGYGVPITKQRNFYKKNGFVREDRKNDVWVCDLEEWDEQGHRKKRSERD